MGSIGEPPENGASPDFDVLVVGAGLSGIYTIYRLRQLGLTARVLEGGSDVGGTWYWNRYPGARFDSESYSYQFFWDQELMNEWHWDEHFAGQPEIAAYINRVVEKHDLRKEMQFNTRVQKARFDSSQRIWTLTDQDGTQYTCRWFVSALGILTNPTLPNIPGVDSFKGEAHHTSRWPTEPVKLEGKRVAVIGTGATGIQLIQEVSKTAGTLTVFQRTPMWACPMHNAKIDAEEMQQLREWYPQMMKQCAEGYQGFLHNPESRKTTDVTDEERERIWEELYAARGFGIWFSNFADVPVDREANNKACAFLAKKIRQRVKDQDVAEKLIPKNHGFATRRVPLETNYFEVYNQPNVTLVDINETPIERISESGIHTSAEDYEFDVICYATGFDAVTGSYDAIDTKGLDDKSLKDTWWGGPKTYLGFATERFPNLFMVMGPHQAFGNNPRSIEYAVEWITEAIRYFEDQGITYVEAKREGVEKWNKQVNDLAKGGLMNDVDSWMTGVNRNVGKTTRYVARYSGSNKSFRDWCDEVRNNRYDTFKMA